MAGTRNSDRPSLPYGPDVRTGVRTSTQPTPRVPTWSPEELSLIRHIAEEAVAVINLRSSADLYQEAEKTITRKVEAGTRRHRRREIAAWVSLVVALATFVIDRMRLLAAEAEREPPPPITIPIVEPSPNAGQVQTQGNALEQVRRDIDTLLRLEAERAAREIERDAKPAKGRKPR